MRTRRDKSLSSRKAASLSVALILMLLVLCSVVMEAAAHPWVSDGLRRAYSAPDQVGPQATLHTKINITADGTSDGIDSICLAGFGDGATGIPNKLALIWSADPNSSFWVTWRLQMKTQDQTYNLGSAVQPIEGHTYESWLSYNQSTGGLAIVLVDNTSDTVIFRGDIQLSTTVSGAYAGAGYILKESAKPIANPLTLVDLEASSRFLPLAYEWALEARTPDGQALPSSQFDLPEQMVIELNAHAPQLAGIFRFQLKQGGTVTDLGQLQPKEGTSQIVIPVNSIPIGPSRVTVQYVENGEVLLSNSKDIQVGTAQVLVGALSYNRATSSLASTVTLKSNGTMTVDLTFKATLTELVWNTKTRKFDEMPRATHVLWQKPFTLHAGNNELPIAIPMPEQPSTWRVDFEVATNPTPRITTYGMQQYLTTYRPAKNEPGQPYTIAIIPDTQSYTTKFPEAFMRKTQWLSEKAEQLNLGMVLHVGDITETNTPSQWENAAKAIHLLDGVVPYVLTIGAGHDFSSSRDGTLFNNYFTVENAVKNSNLAGVYKDGRLEDSYSLFTLGGQDYLVIALNSGPSNGAVAWANELADRYNDRKVMVVTHMNMAKQGTFLQASDLDQWPASAYYFSRGPGESVNNGDQLWDKLYSKHANMLMTWSGHVGVTAITRRVDKADSSNPVFSLMADYQNAPHGGDGWMVLMTFNPDDTVDVRAYSPYLNEYKTDIDRFGFNSTFTIDIKSGLYAPTKKSAVLDTLR